jgi:arylformamidase
MRLIDVTLPLSAALPVYPGNPALKLDAIERLAEGGSANLSRLTLGTHSGTHVDAPRHFFDEGDSAEQLSLELLTGPARVVAIDGAAIGADAIAGADIGDAARVLFKTRNSEFWSAGAFRSDYTFLTEDGARALVARGVRLVGVDYLSIEEFRKPGAPAHRVLLGSGTIIIEGLDLRRVTPGVYDMFCLPLPLVGADGAPARVVLRGPLAG